MLATFARFEPRFALVREVGYILLWGFLASTLFETAFAIWKIPLLALAIVGCAFALLGVYFHLEDDTHLCPSQIKVFHYFELIAWPVMAMMFPVYLIGRVDCAAAAGCAEPLLYYIQMARMFFMFAASVTIPLGTAIILIGRGFPRPVW